MRSFLPSTGRTTADQIHPALTMNSSHQPDPYTVLGVDPTATAEQITHAYRALLRRHHPDTRVQSPTDQMRADPPHADDARLQRVLTAYAVLRDPAQRANYDRHHQANPPQPPEPGPGQRHTPLTPRPAPGPVMIGRIEQHRPAWIAPAGTMVARSDRPTQAGLLERLLGDLFGRPR